MSFMKDIEAAGKEEFFQQRSPLQLPAQFAPASPFPKAFDFIESLIKGGGFREWFFEKTRASRWMPFCVTALVD